MPHNIFKMPGISESFTVYLLGETPLYKMVLVKLDMRVKLELYLSKYKIVPFKLFKDQIYQIGKPENARRKCRVSTSRHSQKNP